MRQRRHPVGNPGFARVLVLVSLLGVALAQSTPPPAPATPATQPTSPQEGSPATEEQPGTPAGEALPQVSITLERTTKSGEKRRIEIVRVGTDETGISATCSPRDEDPEDAPTVVVYSDTTERGVQVTVDKNLIRAPLAIITKQKDGDGHIEMTAGTARYLDEAPAGKTDRLSLCEVEATPVIRNDTVRVTQGKTNLRGSKLVYDEEDGVARIAGPITFTREKLTGSSTRIDVDVEQEVTTLVGNVQFRDGERVSSAEYVDYDDTKNVAILRGSAAKPAETRTSKEVLRAEVIRYNLDTGEAVVMRGEKPITGTFEDGDGAGSGGAPGGSAP